MIGYKEAKNNPHWQQLSKSFGMDGTIDQKEDYKRIKHFISLAGADKIDAENVTKLEGVFQDFKDHVKEKGIELSTGESAGLYRPEDVSKVFDSIKQTEDYKYLDQQKPEDTQTIEEGGVKKKIYDIPDHLSDTHLKNEHGLNEAQAQEFETDFIDDMWGTSGGEVGTASGFGEAHEKGWTDSPTFGLDFKRVDHGFEIGSDEHYEHITRGEVDWAAYADDKMYSKAMSALGYDANQLLAKDPETGKQLLSEAKRAGIVKEATALIHGKAGDEDDIDDAVKEKAEEKWGKEAGVKKWDDWTPEDWKFDNPYNDYKMEGGELYLDGERQIKMREKLAIPAGESKMIEVGKDDKGKPIMKEVKSGYINASQHVHINGKKSSSPFMGGNTTDVDIKIKSGDGTVWKTTIPPVKTPTKISDTPNIAGIQWSKDGKPSLKNPTEKIAKPVIKPVSNKSWSQGTQPKKKAAVKGSKTKSTN